MKKNVLAMGVATMIGGLAMSGSALAMVDLVTNQGSSATVLQVNGDNIGHMLVVPYFSVQGSNDTYLNITNTDTVNGKAVKVRFRGASNSDDVFDFQVFLSPGDMWAAALTRDDAGEVKLNFNDTSCTLPAQATLKARRFIKTRVDGSLSAEAKIAQTKEGYVEIINMADIPEDLDPDSLYQTTKHKLVGGVWKAPCVQTVLDTLAEDPANATRARALGLDNPTTGLTASWVVLNTAEVKSYSGVATAIEARDVAGIPAVPGVDTGNIVFSPQTNVEVGATQADAGTADALYISAPVDAAGVTLTGPIVQPLRWDFPDLSTPYLLSSTAADQALDVSAALAVESVANEYVVGGAAMANTDWLFSMPTRRYAVAVDYGKSTTTPAYQARLIHNPAVADYFSPLTGGNVVLGTGDYARVACVRGVNAGSGYFNREELQPTIVPDSPVFDVSPGVPGDPPAQVLLCGEASVVNFASNVDGGTDLGGVSTLSAAITKTTVTLDEGYTEGWVPVTTPGQTGVGLPIVGYAAVHYKGVTGNYGALWAHRVVRVPVAVAP